MQALSGMRVLEISQYEAGPTCCQLLAWLGAEVIKIEQPGGEPGRHVLGDGSYNEQYFFNYNSNKKNIVIDYKNPQGTEVINQLIAESDILVENLGPGVMENYGLGYDNALKHNESIIYASIKGFGLSGPLANFKSFDPLA